MEYFTIAKDTLTIIFAVIGSIVAIKGLSTWRRQLKGNYEYELAKRILKALYRSRDVIAQVRSPFIWARESVEAIEKLSKNAEQDLKDFWKSDNHIGYVYEARWTKYSKVSTELQSNFYEAEVIWGKTFKDVTVKYNQHISNLSFAINEHLRSLQSKASRINRSAEEIEEEEKNWRIVSPISNEDPYKHRLEEIITEFETFLKPYIVMHSKQ